MFGVWWFRVWVFGFGLHICGFGVEDPLRNDRASCLRLAQAQPILHTIPTLRVQGSGFRVQGLGFRVQGVGFRVEGLGFRV